MTRKALAFQLAKEFMAILVSLGGPAFVVVALGMGVLYWFDEDSYGWGLVIMVIGVFTFAATMIWDINRPRLDHDNGVS